MSEAKKHYFNWVEVHLAAHCNLRCRSCTHHSPYLESALYPLHEFKKDILAFSKVARLNLLKFLGGEPLLNKEIVSYIRAAKETRVARIYCVVTNGILLRSMEDDFFRAVDRIEVSLYPALQPSAAHLRELLALKSQRFGFTYDVAETKSFYNVEVERRLSQQEVEYTYAHCDRIRQGHFMNCGFFYKCMRPVSTLPYLRNRGVAGELPDFALVDGVALHEPGLMERIRLYMQSAAPLQSCQYCRMGFKNEYTGSWYRRLKGLVRRQRQIKLFLYRNKKVLSLYSALTRTFERTSGNQIQSAGDIPFHPHELMSAGECKPRLVNIAPLL